MSVNLSRHCGGRDTPFDDDTKLGAICNKVKTADELAFIVKSLFVGLKRFPPSMYRDVPSRSNFVARTGDLTRIQMTRVVVGHVLMFCKSCERFVFNRLESIQVHDVW